MQAIADKEGAKLKIEPWDYRFYAEKVRKAKYDLDENEIKPYLQLEKLREGMFWAAGEVYGMSFTPVTNVPVQHPDVRVWEVKRNGAHLGLFYFDPYARTGKRSGAWALDKNAPEAKKGFLLNHLISELLPEREGGYRYSNSDPVTGQAAWYDLRVRIEKAADQTAMSEPRFGVLKKLGRSR